jgi:hypothetical protein
VWALHQLLTAAQTLLSEYGFVLARERPPDAPEPPDWTDSAYAEVNVDAAVIALLAAQGKLGARKREVLQERGYWL